MNRRAFIAASAAALVAVPAAADPSKYREFHRYDRPTDRWIPIEFEHIKDRMEIWIGNKGVHPDEVVLVSRGYHPCDEAIHVTMKIDPKTNQWVTASAGA